MFHFLIIYIKSFFFKFFIFFLLSSSAFFLFNYNLLSFNIYNLYNDSFGILFIFYNILITASCSFYFFSKKNINKVFMFFSLVLVICLSFFFLLTSNNVYSFFLSYEFLMLPSSILIYISSPNIRSKYITFYYTMWTQSASTLLFVTLSFFFSENIYFFNISKSNLVYSNILPTLLFFSFGVKTPIWPFHFWLTKTHVEVNTSFSIILSGVLVKVSIFGYYKFYYFFYNSNLFLIICIITCLDISLKMWSQVDLKKIVAYCTIFEMNIITMLLFNLDSNKINTVILFSILHTTFSNSFFSISDFVYKRYNSRNVLSIPSLLKNSPLLGYLLVLNVVLFNGLPLFLKFNLEISVSIKLISFDLIMFLFFLLSNLIFLMSFNKIIYTVLFNNIKSKVSLDLSKYELILLLINLSPLLWLLCLIIII